jgi:uracil-DNA glycosylase family 4
MTVSDERARLIGEVRAHLEWELAGAGIGVPAEALRPTGQGLRGPASSPAVAPPEVEATVRTQLAAIAEGTAPARLGADERRVRLAQLEEEVKGCTRCELHRARTQTVFARGNPDARLVFIGEGPGQEEDRTGLPFVGPAGQLLDKMVAAMGQQRDDVYICNIVKCRPPNNRTPLPSEGGACSSYLLGQLDAIAPQVIVALGRCAAENLGLVSGGGWRGRWGSFRGIPVMPTYHPAFLLRSPEFKRPVWEDLQKVMAKLASG